MESLRQAKKMALIVDDNPSDATISKYLLADMNFVSLHANNGLEALDIFDQYSFSLIVVDLQMPVMSGLELLRRLQAKKIRTPILVTSGRNESKDVKGAVDLGAKDYMIKPLDLAMYREKILRLTGNEESNWFQYEVRQESPIRQASLSFDIQLISLSEVGCQVQTSFPFPDNSLIRLDSLFLQQQSLHDMMGRVLTCENKHGSYTLFIFFVGLKEEQKQKIRVLCRQLWTQG